LREGSERRKRKLRITWQGGTCHFRRWSELSHYGNKVGVESIKGDKRQDRLKPAILFGDQGQVSFDYIDNRRVFGEQKAG